MSEQIEFQRAVLRVRSFAMGVVGYLPESEYRDFFTDLIEEMKNLRDQEKEKHELD